MLQAAKDKQSAVAISWVWALGFYYKSYALNEMGNLAGAKLYMDRAIALSPKNPVFLMERANLYLKEKNLQAAYSDFQTAADSAPQVSPPNLKNAELGRAWRGMGYVLAEQNRLSEAEKIYLRCLNLDKGDVRAAAELKYVHDLKMKRARSRR